MLFNPAAYLAAGVGLVGALLDAVADGVAVLVDLAHAPRAAVHLQARVWKTQLISLVCYDLSSR